MPLNLRPYGMQRAVSACRLGRPVWGILGVPPLLLVLRGQKGVKWGPVVNNGENIASGRQSLGMRPRHLRPCGSQRTLSACRPGTPKWGLLGVPPFL